MATKEEKRQQAWDTHRRNNGQQLMIALQRHDEQRVESFLSLGEDEVHYATEDDSGMTCLHYAARLVNSRWVQRLLNYSPSSANAITFYARTPSQWSVLNCVADVPKPKTQIERDEHTTIVLLLVGYMSREAILNVTKHGTTCLHQLTGRGHDDALKAVLPKIEAKVGKEQLAALLNRRVGKDGLGAVDTALRSYKVVVPLLKQFGGLEQAECPSNWKQGRRRATDSSCNGRSDPGEKSGSRWEKSSWTWSY